VASLAVEGGADAAADASSVPEGDDSFTSDATASPDGTLATDGGADGASHDASDGGSSQDAAATSDAGDAGAPDGGGFCAHPVPLTDGGVGQSLASVVADDTSVYWYEPQATTADGGTAARVSKVAVGGGPVVVLYESAACAGAGPVMAANSTTLYIACGTQLDATRHVEIMQIPKDESVAPTPFWISDTSTTNCFGTGPCTNARWLGADDTSVYVQIIDGNGPIMKMPVGGGALVKVTPVPGDADYTANMWSTDVTGNMMTVGGTLYYTGRAAMNGTPLTGTYGLWSVPASGGDPTLLASGAPFAANIVGGLVPLNGNFYWATYPQVFKMPMTGGTPTSIAMYALSAVQELALFGNSLYLAGYYSGALRLESVPVDQTDGGPATVVHDFASATDYTPLPGSQQVVANGSQLFFADPGLPSGGKIYRCD
jgi:hypothetical protein